MTKHSGSAHVKDWAVLEPSVQTDKSPLEFNPQCKITERSDLMVECLTRDRRVTGSSLTCGTAAVCVLEQDTLFSSKYCFNPGRPTWHDSKTQRINSNKQSLFNTYATEDWNNIYDSFHCKIKLPYLLLELTIARCSGLKMLSRLFRAHRRVIVWIVSEISIFSEPLK